jgi:transposase
LALRAGGEATWWVPDLAKKKMGGGEDVAWLGLSRRFSKDYERLPETAEAMIYGAMSHLMLRRLARAA